MIPLPDGHYAYIQYILWHPDMGSLVRVFDRTTSEPLSSAGALAGVGDLFGPVFVGLSSPVNRGRWKLIGSLPVKEQPFPRFRATSATKPGSYDNWWIWDGQTEVPIGRLPSKLRSLERRALWGDEALEQRIATGIDPFEGVQ